MKSLASPINFVPSYLPRYSACLICIQSVEQTNKQKGEKKREKQECSPAMCTVLFMKALSGTMETNYLLTMWNRNLFTRLRFPLLFLNEIFLNLLICISRHYRLNLSKPISLKKGTERKTNESLLVIKQAIRCIYECKPHQPPATDTHHLCPLQNHLVRSLATYSPQFDFKPNTVCIVERPLWKAALRFGKCLHSLNRQQVKRDQSGETRLTKTQTVSLHHRAAVNNHFKARDAFHRLSAYDTKINQAKHIVFVCENAARD